MFQKTCLVATTAVLLASCHDGSNYTLAARNNAELPSRQLTITSQVVGVNLFLLPDGRQYVSSFVINAGGQHFSCPVDIEREKISLPDEYSIAYGEVPLR